jgi:hypothetical protein
MIITMICPSCGKLATAPRAAAGARGKCAHCGCPIEVPRHNKNCKVCGKDTSGLKRIKDPEGSYYCAPCYEIAKARAVNAATPVVPPVADLKSPAVPPAAPPPGAVLASGDSASDLHLSTALHLDDDQPAASPPIPITEPATPAPQPPHDRPAGLIARLIQRIRPSRPNGRP